MTPSPELQYLRMVWVSVSIIAFACGVFCLALAAGPDAVAIAWIRPLLHPRDQRNLAFFTAFLRDHILLAISWAAVSLASAVVFAWSIRQRRFEGCVIALVALSAGTAHIAGNVVVPAYAAQRTMKPLFEALPDRLAPEDEIFLVGTADYGAVFYARRDLRQTDLAAARDRSGCTYLLMRARDWTAIPTGDRERLRLIEPDSIGPDTDAGKLLLALSPGVGCSADLDRSRDPPLSSQHRGE